MEQAQAKERRKKKHQNKNEIEKCIFISCSFRVVEINKPNENENMTKKNNYRREEK